MVKVEFKDLSGWLKVAIIAGWILAGYSCLLFIAGFMNGVLG